ncbi:DUF3489 domain-containing protein [Methylobacterium sp. J-026]|uniref:DUF3489 domain-containing protein n=1 Tax=Methylobacterium sp. J-026 TaxID=2836624 RepID=UPI001FBAD7DF|nr:DUF3489 domain-containing protein [Methylobacterium sp. J-026]MCJ2136850.1 DUF3489 domain-containing protein [Methylobacterium sp. J-026]
MSRKPKSDTLSPIQHRILTAAISHPGHQLARPGDIKPPTYRSALQALRRRGLVTDSVSEDGSGRRSAAPVLSEAGFAHVAPATLEVETVAKPELSSVRAPRAGSKLDRLVAMLARPDSAGIDELVGALGWLPHTTRAALTGLRKRGYALSTIRTADAPTRYRIASNEPHASDTAAPAASEIATVTEEATR